MPEAVYVVRYGAWNHLGRLAVGDEAGVGVDGLRRGQPVVIRTPRGLELGEVLAGPQAGSADGNAAGSRIVRPAGAGDLAAADATGAIREACLAACETVFGAGTWPIEFVDVEVLPALDRQPARALIAYLGPHALDTAGLVDLFRERFDLTVAFEPVGQDAADEPDPEAEEATASGCGSGGCGTSGGGCGSGGCGTSGGGCSGCAVAGLAKSRRALPTG